MKYATTVVYLGIHIFPRFLENSRSHSNAYNLISSKNKHQLNDKGIDDSKENLYNNNNNNNNNNRFSSGITDDYQNYEKCECSDRCIKREPENEK